MNKAILGGMVIVAILVLVLLLALTSSTDLQKKDVVFHATLADPKLYQNGVFTDTFEADAGTYHFRFVPNGSSPETLSITLAGSSMEFSQDFVLVGTKAETAEYYTWKYDGRDTITVPETQEITIAINPNGNILGSVSVDILGD
ncbi:MAG: hypothetical protein D9C04_02830 [Nitrosopumilus sp. B06]|nr:MAG: hypothetical protein EB828_05660 [Nitrosopumilus sp. D6]RNJ80067.1 MAG: hypothetical protein D9C04_02830 [Nitrosopumilus sp. B06]